MNFDVVRTISPFALNPNYVALFQHHWVCPRRLKKAVWGIKQERNQIHMPVDHEMSSENLRRSFCVLLEKGMAARALSDSGVFFDYRLTSHGRELVKAYLASVVLVIMMVIGLTAVNFGEGFGTNMIIGQSIGTSMFFCASITLYLLRNSSPFTQMVAAMVAMITGAVMGFFFGSIAAGKDLRNFIPGRQEIIIEVFALSIITGFLFRYILNAQKRISDAEAKIHREKIKRLTIEKQVVETNLRLLQAQIEPHFLFNTLSNILTLNEMDTKKGRIMLEDLISYLRITLSKARQETSTIAQEMELIRAYLNIFKIRMGERLEYEIHIDEGLKHKQIPPMLIQPLVENAIEHGLEPKIEGGTIWISSYRRGDYICLEVADSGLSFHKDNDWGVGLSNIRDRLLVLYDGNARFVFEKNTPVGLKVIIEVPIWLI